MRADARRAALAAALLASLLALPALPASADRARPVEAGERAPDIALPDQHGRPFRLTDALAERDYLVVAFYVKAFTGG